ncbi:MAG: hypothetical protein Q9192_008591 [Flavoplaca navasiana]
MLTPDLDRKAPARMHVEILSNHLHDMAWQGRLRFVVTDFPTDQDQATIFEEDCTLIEAFVLVEGKKLGQITQPAGEESSAALRSVFEKFDAVGRAFKINVDQDPRELRDDISKLVKAFKDAKEHAASIFDEVIPKTCKTASSQMKVHSAQRCSRAILAVSICDEAWDETHIPYPLCSTRLSRTSDLQGIPYPLRSTRRSRTSDLNAFVRKKKKRQREMAVPIWVDKFLTINTQNNEVKVWKDRNDKITI